MEAGILDLPDELTRQICLSLDYDSLRSFMMTNRAAYRACSDLLPILYEFKQAERNMARIKELLLALYEKKDDLTAQELFPILLQRYFHILYTREEWMQFMRRIYEISANFYPRDVIPRPVFERFLKNPDIDFFEPLYSQSYTFWIGEFYVVIPRRLHLRISPRSPEFAEIVDNLIRYFVGDVIAGNAARYFQYSKQVQELTKNMIQQMGFRIL